MTSDRQKPAGVVVISIYSAFSGTISLFAGLVFILASAIPNIPAWIYMLSVVFVLFGVLLLASVYGLWSLQSWGRSLTFWLYIISIPLGIISIFPIFPSSKMSAGNTLFQLFGIGVDIAVIIYLKKDEIQNLEKGVRV